MISTENRVGKLVEIRFARPVTPEEVAAATAFMDGIETKYRGQNVNLVDLRFAGVNPQDVVDPLIDRLHRRTPPLKAALVLEGTSIQRMQAKRVVRAGGEDSRVMLASTVAEVTDFLADVLNEPELQRVRAFLASMP